jgi:hypothetical protein
MSVKKPEQKSKIGKPLRAVVVFFFVLLAYLFFVQSHHAEQGQCCECLRYAV